VDVEALREMAEALTLMRSDRAILAVPRLHGIPVTMEESLEVSGQIARIVFEPIGPERTLSEAQCPEARASSAAPEPVPSDVALSPCC